MKNILTIFFACFYLNIATAQVKIPSFGKIDKADLEMTDCDFDKGAIALKLIDHGKMFFDRGTAGITLFKTVYEYRVRIKILKDKGLSYANLEIPFYSNNNDETISAIDANTYNLDEAGKVKITGVNKGSIYTKKINNRFSRLIIAFPEVKVGSVIEYKYKLMRDTYSQIKDWYFQSEIPTRYSEYEVTTPTALKYKTQKFVVNKLDEKSNESVDVVSVGNDAFSFETKRIQYAMNDLPGIKDLPFMGAPKDYEQHIEFQLVAIERGIDNTKYINSTWADIVKALNEDEDFGLQLTRPIKDMDGIIKQSLQIINNTERIKFLFNTIRSKMNCTDDEAIFTNQGITNAWEKKSGNIAEINMLLIQVLNKAGIKAMPILLSTRNNGLVNKFYYSERQFNTLMAYVPLENSWLVLDATDKLSNYRLTPESVVNTSGFIIDGEEGKWIDILDEKHKYQIVVALQGIIDDKGLMKGDCSINCMDYARKQRVDAYIKNKDNFKQEYFIKPYPAISVENVIVKNDDADSLPFSQKVIFSLPLSNSGEYRYFNTNMFNDFEKNPFIEDERAADIDFGMMQEYVIYCNFTIPDGYVFETLPENISMLMPDKSIQYTRIMNTSDNVLNIKINIDFKTSFYPAGNYPDFHEFYKKLLNSLNEQVVIKKK